MYIHGHFYNENDERISVLIVTRGDRSKELVIGGEELCFSEDPVETESQVNDTFDHLLLTQARIRLLCRNYIGEFFTSSCRDAIVNIYRGDVCMFAGYIEPMTLSQGYNEYMDEIELTCIDALCALQYSKYRNIGALGVFYSVVKAESAQRRFAVIMNEILDGVTSGIDILGGKSISVLYDGSKALDKDEEERNSIFEDLSINEMLFLGDDEDDVWQQDEVLEEMLKYLNLHIVQDGLTFYIYSWETVKGDKSICWHDLQTDDKTVMERKTVDITSNIAVGTDTKISVGEVYNEIRLTCDVTSIDGLIESPLDDDLLKSPYSNKQKYVTEYSSLGEGKTAEDAFREIIKKETSQGGYEGRYVTDYDGATVTDWWIQVKRNSGWRFTDVGSGDLLSKYCNENKNQQKLADVLSKQIGCCLLSWGKDKRDLTGRDNTMKGSVEMKNYLMVSVNGVDLMKRMTTGGVDEIDKELLKSSPVALYEGSASGGVFSPSDDDTTNYIVISGKISMNPNMYLTDSFANIENDNWTRQTVGYGEDADENRRFYTMRWYDAQTPSSNVTEKEGQEQWLKPMVENRPRRFQYNYSAIGDDGDKISKVGVLACQLIIGDKCVVEVGTEGHVSDLEWHPYHTLEELGGDVDKYYQQSFTIGIDPKIGDYLIGTDYEIQNNISDALNLDTKGTAIRIKRSDHVNGKVTFKILGPVNMIWNDITRRHKTWFRHTSWHENDYALLCFIESVMLEQFEVKIYSDNGLVNNTGDNDIVYISDTDESYVNKKDDIEFKINSALTSEECQMLDVTDGLKMSTPLNVRDGEGLKSIYDVNIGESVKAEQLYVNSYYKEYHAPRLEMTQKIEDKENGIVDLFCHYRHPYMGKTFFVEGISRNLEEGYAEMKLKEINV